MIHGLSAITNGHLDGLKDKTKPRIAKSQNPRPPKSRSTSGKSPILNAGQKTTPDDPGGLSTMFGDIREASPVEDGSAKPLVNIQYDHNP